MSRWLRNAKEQLEFPFVSKDEKDIQPEVNKDEPSKKTVYENHVEVVCKAKDSDYKNDFNKPLVYIKPFKKDMETVLSEVVSEFKLKNFKLIHNVDVETSHDPSIVFSYEVTKDDEIAYDGKVWKEFLEKFFKSPYVHYITSEYPSGIYVKSKKLEK